MSRCEGRLVYCAAMEGSKHPSSVDPGLTEAYRATRYRVLLPPAFDMRVDAYSPALEAVMGSAGVQAAAFVTAWNPRGEPQGLVLNRERQDRLRFELRSVGLRFIEGFGAHAENEDEGEESLLVLGLDRPAACALGRRHQQNAIVWSDDDAVPRLLLLR